MANRILATAFVFHFLSFQAAALGNGITSANQHPPLQPRSRELVLAMAHQGVDPERQSTQPARLHNQNGGPKLYRGKNSRRRDALKQLKEIEAGQAGIGGNSKRFVPTHQWQRVQPGQAVPRGLEIRMDMSGGGTFARLPGGPPAGVGGSFFSRPFVDWKTWGPALGVGAVAAGLGTMGFHKARTGVLASLPGRRILAPAILAYLGIVNVWSAVSVVKDKHNAVMGQWRIPERRFIELALAGGWVLGCAAMVVSRHKTQKQSFLAPYVVASGANAAVSAALLRLPPVRLSFALFFGLSGM